MPRHAKGLKRKPRNGAFLLSSNIGHSRFTIATDCDEALG
nr:MAG TPA: hypothetical protein [Caudoviricetes sp.]